MSSQDESASIDASGNAFKTEFSVGPQISTNLEQTQIGKFHTKGGTGFAAEDANSFADVLQGRKVEQVGRSNSLNGADRIVDGVSIQTKYYESATSTMRSAFDSNGVYRYSGQRLEVPADQYDACLAQMKRKIEAGKVPGVTNPADAETIIQKGSVSYRQARNIARAGTIDGLTYDSKTHAVGAGFACGLSFAIQFAQQKWGGASTEEALKEAAITGLSSGAISFSAGILSSQVLRTRAAALGVKTAKNAVRAVHSTELGRAVVKKLAEVSLGRVVHGGAAINHVAKLARSNVVSSVVVTTVMSTPDIYRAAFAGNISWGQLGKNVAVNASGVAGGVGGWAGGGIAGAALGSVVPGVGTVAGGVIGGIIGSITGGSLTSFGAKKALDMFVEDDAVAMLRLIEMQLPDIASECMLNESEVIQLIDYLKQKVKSGYLRDLYASETRDAMVAVTFKLRAFELVQKRELIVVPDQSEVEAIVVEIVEMALEAADELSEVVDTPRSHP